MDQQLHSKGRTCGSSAYKRSRLALAVAAALAAPSIALGQGLVLEEIVVTATKKDELLSDIASTVNVVTGDSLNQFNIFQFEDVQKLTPGLTLQNFTARSSGISLRGAPYNPDSSAAATVVTYWNEIPVLPNVAFNRLFDIERIEVLRGAQGTLQGETSPSGSIQIHTKKANPYLAEGYIRQTFDDNDGAVTEFGAGLPLIADKLGVRVAGVYDSSAVWGEESINGGKESSSRTKAGRISLYFTPTDNLNASLTYEYLERDADGLTTVEGRSKLGNDTPVLDTFDRISLESGNSVLSRNELVNLTVNYEVADHTLTLVSGYQDVLHHSYLDMDAGDIFPDFVQLQETKTGYEVWSHELRLTNSAPDFWGYLFGVYYNHAQMPTSNRNLSPAMFSYLPGFIGPQTGAPGMPALGLTDSTTSVPVTQETFALFMNHTFYFTDALTVDFGLRWQDFRQAMTLTTTANSDIDFGIIQVPEGTVLATLPEGMGKNSSEAVTGSLKISYDLTPETMVYGSYGRSFRPGGNVVEPTPGIDLSLVEYDEETSNSLEFGFKSMLADGRYQINGAIYYQQYEDFISRSDKTLLAIGAPELNTTALGGINYNADAVIRGAELEATGLLAENWLVFASLSYNDAKFDGGEVPCGNFGDAADPGSQLRTCKTDGRMGPAPNWSGSVTSEYTVREVVAGGDLYLRGLYRFTGSRHDDFAAVNTQLYDEYRLGSYGVWDLYVGLRAADESWDVSLWAKNVFDKEARTALGSEYVHTGTELISAGALPPGTTPPATTLESGYSSVSVIPERTIGITGTWRFGGF